MLERLMMVESASSRVPVSGSASALASGVIEVLEGLRRVLGGLTQEQYCARSGELFAGGSVGGHVRHCLDHIRAVVDEPSTGVIDYDHRERGTDIEGVLTAAQAELSRLEAGVRRLAARGDDEAVRVRVMPRRDGQSVELTSSIGRELAFVLSHTVHHNATIRSLVLSMGASAPEAFGSAPSTLAHKDRASGCACRGAACAH